MVELAYRGAIDFTTFDPQDYRSWLRLAFLREAEERRRAQELTQAQLLRSVVVASSSELTKESLESNLTASSDRLRQLVKLSYPWQHFEDTTAAGGSDPLLAAYKAEFGQPGDERYDTMIATFNKQLKARRNANKH